MEFKDKVLQNARKFARRFSIKGQHQRDKKIDIESHRGENKENQCKLTRSQSARLTSEVTPKRIRPMSTVVRGDDNESAWHRTLCSIQAGSVTNLKRLLQFNKLSSVKDRFNINGYDKYGRTLAIHFAAKCPS